MLLLSPPSTTRSHNLAKSASASEREFRFRLWMVLRGGTCRALFYGLINALFSAPGRTLRGRIPACSPHLPIEAARPPTARMMRADVKCLPVILNHGCRWTCAYLRRNTSGALTGFLGVPLDLLCQPGSLRNPEEPAMNLTK